MSNIIIKKRPVYKFSATFQCKTSKISITWCIFKSNTSLFYKYVSFTMDWFRWLFEYLTDIDYLKDFN